MIRALRMFPLVVFVPLVQVSIVERIDFFGASPDLVVMTAVAIGLLSNSVVGSICGFAMGLELGVFATLQLGPHAIVATCIGYWSGRWGEQLVTDRHPLPPLVACLCATLAMSVGRPLVEFLLTPASGSLGGIWSQALAVTLLNVVLMTPMYVAVRVIAGTAVVEPLGDGVVAR